MERGFEAGAGGVRRLLVRGGLVATTMLTAAAVTLASSAVAVEAAPAPDGAGTGRSAASDGPQTTAELARYEVTDGDGAVANGGKSIRNLAGGPGFIAGIRSPGRVVRESGSGLTWHPVVWHGCWKR